LTGITTAFTWTLIGQGDFIGVTLTEEKPVGTHGGTVPNTGEELLTGTELRVSVSDSHLRYREKQGVTHAGSVKGLVGTHRREGPSSGSLREEICSARRPADLTQGEAHRVRMPSVVLVEGILSAERVTADSRAGKASGPVVEDRCVAGMEPAVAEKSAVAAELPVAADSAVAVDSMAGADSVAAALAAALAAAGDKMKDSKKAKITKELISKTTFLSFPGLTGESRKTLDARLSLSPQVVSGETLSMTYRDIV
jgi:hypothetical protein